MKNIFRNGDLKLGHCVIKMVDVRPSIDVWHNAHNYIHVEFPQDISDSVPDAPNDTANRVEISDDQGETKVNIDISTRYYVSGDFLYRKVIQFKLDNSLQLLKLHAEYYKAYRLHPRVSGSSFGSFKKKDSFDCN